MGVTSCSVNTLSHAHLFSLLLLLSSTKAFHLVEGRPLVKLQEIAKEDEGEDTVAATMIGSRPPRCQGRCLNCGQCEAVQVPAIPRDKSWIRHFSTTIASRGDGSSNYKPLSWKCKCGGVIINP